jgi:hypothetical protein
MKFPFASREKKKSSPWFWLRPHNNPSSKKGLLQTKHALVTRVSTSGWPTIPPPSTTRQSIFDKDYSLKLRQTSITALVASGKRCLSSCVIWRVSSGGRNLAGRVPAHGRHVQSIRSKWRDDFAQTERSGVSAPKDLHLALKTRSPLFS